MLWIDYCAPVDLRSAKHKHNSYLTFLFPLQIFVSTSLLYSPYSWSESKPLQYHSGLPWSVTDHPLPFLSKQGLTVQLAVGFNSLRTIPFDLMLRPEKVNMLTWQETVRWILSYPQLSTLFSCRSLVFSVGILSLSLFNFLFISVKSPLV